MSWKKGFRTGSFRGVPFFVRSADDGGGRRKAEHIYGGRDTPWSEDLGRKQKTYNLTVFVIGTDYFKQRDALEEALNKKGPGILIHPWRGSLDVTVEYRVQHSSDDGGLCYFSLTCTESGHNKTPEVMVDSADNLLVAADRSKVSSTKEFLDKFTLEKVANYVKLDTVEYLAGLVSNIQKSASPLSIESVVSNISKINALLNDPADLGSAVYNLVASGTNTKNLSVLRRLAQLRNLFKYEIYSDSTRLDTVGQRQITNNTVALDTLVNNAVSVESAKILALANYEDVFNDRHSAADSVTLIEKQLEYLLYQVSDIHYLELNDLRVVMLNDFKHRSVELPEIKQIKLQQTEPALVVAYREYGQVDRAAQIVKMNNINHPSFIVAGVPLEILNA